jgi:eukaryotic-like serine/threonine-protein kinase
MNPLAGSTLGKYQVIEEIGKGGMARVYKAFQPSLSRFVAIKVLHSHLMEGQSILERFQREARAAASLRHPNIVQVFDFDVQGNLYYMVMEFIDGTTLKDMLERLAQSGKRLSVEEAIRIFSQVSDALSYAHNHGMLHRDIKPSNILIDQTGNAYLSDFGIARIISEKQITLTGALIGTPEYMSPEQALGQPITPATDVYSLGITLYETLTCQVPFSAHTPMSVMQKQISQPPPPLVNFRPDLPAMLETVLRKALEKNSRDRYQTVSEFQEAIQIALTQPDRGQTIIEPFKTPLTATIVEPVPSYQQPLLVTPPAVLPPSSPVQKKKSVFIFAVLSATFMFALLLFGVFSGWIKTPFLSLGNPQEENKPSIVIVVSATPEENTHPASAAPPTEQSDFDEPQPVEPTQTPLPPSSTFTQTPVPHTTENDTPTPTLEKPTLLADQNYFCRQRPDTTSDEHWVFKTGVTAPLIGKSNNNWWLIGVDDPSTRTKCCWVAGGHPNGNLEIIPLINYEINRSNCPPSP